MNTLEGLMALKGEIDQARARRKRGEVGFFFDASGDVDVGVRRKKLDDLPLRASTRPWRSSSSVP
jgi:hypothetical protein